MLFDPVIPLLQELIFMRAEIGTKDVYPSVMMMMVTGQAWHWPMDFG